jgi:ribosomal silencing factor RsfS
VEYAKNMGKFCIVDGDAKDGWVAVELPFANTLIHLMVKEKRDYYNIEEILEKKWIPSL